MIETRKLHRQDLWQLCNDKSWFALGDADSYEVVLNHADSIQNVTASHIAEIAEIIMKHSETEQSLSSICFDIAKVCTSYFKNPRG